jgi:Spy/CpxP family protein refolding chaperone
MKPSPRSGVNINRMTNLLPLHRQLIPILATLALPLLASVATAQREEGAPAQMAERLQKMAETLNLSPDQHAKIKSIIEKSGPEIREIMAKGRQNASQSDREKVRELLKKQTEEIQSILTEDQRKKFIQAREQRLSPPALDERLAKMTKALALTPEQQAKVKTILTNSATQTRELFAGARDKNAEPDREKMRTNIKKQFEEIETVLTPEQQSKLRAFRQERERTQGNPENKNDKK